MTVPPIDGCTWCAGPTRGPDVEPMVEPPPGLIALTALLL